MSEISFDEEITQVRAAPLAAQQPALVKLVIRWGLAKDPKSAEMLLIGTAVAAGILALVVSFMSVEKNIPAPQVVPLPVQPYTP